MAILSFQDFKFEEDKGKVKAHFLKLFYFFMDNEELKRIGDFKINNGEMEFPSVPEEKARKLFLRALSSAMASLKNKITNNPTLYIHRNSGIPLIGTLAFGIVDKGTDMLEVKPITSCNIACSFCSVDEGLETKKVLDIVVEKDYLVNEVHALLQYKRHSVHIYINPHGEPLLYSDIVDLVHDLSHMEYVKGVFIITNGSLLNEPLMEKFIEAGLTGLNVSLCSLEPDKAKKIAGTDSYDVAKIAALLAKFKDKLGIVISPVYMKGVNDKDIEDLAVYCKENGFQFLIQNFMYNKRGRKPVKELDLDEFYTYLKELEKKYGLSLVKGGKIGHTKELQTPFCKGDVVEAEIFSMGRYPIESWAIAKGRVITIDEPFLKHRKSKVKITADNHNVFYGSIL